MLWKDKNDQIKDVPLLCPIASHPRWLELLITGERETLFRCPLLSLCLNSSDGRKKNQSHSEKPKILIYFQFLSQVRDSFIIDYCCSWKMSRSRGPYLFIWADGLVACVGSLIHSIGWICVYIRGIYMAYPFPTVKWTGNLSSKRDPCMYLKKLFDQGNKWLYPVVNQKILLWIIISHYVLLSEQE